MSKIIPSELLVMLAAALAVVALYSCAKKTRAAERTNADIYFAQKLFSIDGCSVYRYQDLGLYQYFHKCDATLDR